MFLQVPATRDMFSAHFGNGVREAVKPGHFAGFSNNGMGMAGWFDGIDWGSLIETGAKASATIATAQWGQPNLKPGQSIQRVKNSDGSFSEVLMQQPAGLPAGGNAIVAGAAGVSSGMLMMVGIGAVLLFTMQGRGR